tara:strand:+ start:530 stop:1864 length:1335 start_codon:yes stop_codon:yes gene_type:complete
MFYLKKHFSNSALLLSTASFLLFNLFLSFSSYAGDFEYDQNHMKYEDFTYDPNIKSVKLYRDGFSNSYPVLTLNNDTQQLHLSFDDLYGEVKDYGYQFIHCNKDWTPSDLSIFDFQTGPMDDMIREWAFSRIARQRYVHYDLHFPNDRIQLTKSGNYLLIIKNYATGEVVITRRFYITERNAISIDTRMKQATQGRYRLTHHEIDFDIIPIEYQINNPYTNLSVVIKQNNRSDNQKDELQPVFVKSNMLTYDFDNENLFNGLNEFRFFDTRDLTYRALTTRITKTERDTFNVYLTDDINRSTKQYVNYGDINGRYLIHRSERRDSTTIDAQYVKVHFSLPHPAPLVNASVYLYGEFTNWQILPEFKLEYDEYYRSYNTSAFLKQGYYNYMYIYVKDGNPIGDATFFEGNHSDTENEYLFLVYHRKNSEFYDRLIGFHSEVFQKR